MIVRYSRRAERDLADIIGYLADHSPAGARAVASSLREAIRVISEHPRGGKRTQQPEALDILDVRHAPRRPWLS